MPDNHNEKEVRQKFECNRRLKEKYAGLPAECASEISAIKEHIRRGERQSAFDWLDVVQEQINALASSILRYSDALQKLTLERKVDDLERAEFALFLSQRQGDSENTATLQSHIEGINQWMALSIEYLDA